MGVGLNTYSDSIGPVWSPGQGLDLTGPSSATLTAERCRGAVQKHTAVNPETVHSN
jgi:hypothetical protein